jgi:hypothetical protein
MSININGWLIKLFDLAINTVESRLSKNDIIYTTPYNALQKIYSLCSSIDVSAEKINYMLPASDLSIGMLLYMNLNDYKIIRHWDNTKYIIIIRVQINSV